MITEVALAYDGYAVVQVGLQDKCIHCGHSWRIGTGYVTLAAGQYASINFNTPVEGVSLYALASIDKTGDEVEVTLVEGGTYTGGSAITPWNLNRIVGDIEQAFSPVKIGGTITGGLNAPIKLISGTAQGNSKPGGASEVGGNIILLPGTSYTLKCTSVGACTLAAITIISWQPPKI